MRRKRSSCAWSTTRTGNSLEKTIPCNEIHSLKMPPFITDKLFLSWQLRHDCLLPPDHHCARACGGSWHNGRSAAGSAMLRHCSKTCSDNCIQGSGNLSAISGATLAAPPLPRTGESQSTKCPRLPRTGGSPERFSAETEKAAGLRAFPLLNLIRMNLVFPRNLCYGQFPT